MNQSSNTTLPSQKPEISRTYQTYMLFSFFLFFLLCLSGHSFFQCPLCLHHLHWCLSKGLSGPSLLNPSLSCNAATNICLSFYQLNALLTFQIPAVCRSQFLQLSPALILSSLVHPCHILHDNISLTFLFCS